MNDTVALPIPFFYNIPLKPFRSFGAFTFFNVTECNEWYLYKFNSTSTDESDRAYFGHNEGVPMTKPKSSGLLSGGKNILEIPCSEVNRSVPFFVELKENDDKMDDPQKRAEFLGNAREVLSPGRNRTTLNKYMWEELRDLEQEDFNINSKQSSLSGLYKVPDGMIEIQKANKDEFAYRL